MSAAALHRLGGEGPDILFIHGFGADRLSWLALAPKLFPFGTVWAVEYAGHGTAGNDVGEGNPSDLSRAIAAQINGRLAAPLVVGHSLGGTVALHLAARDDMDVSGLVLLAPAGLTELPAPSFIDALPELTDGAAAHDLLKQLVTREVLMTRRMADAFVDSLDDPARRNALRTIAAALKSAPPPPFPPDSPFKVLWGDADAILPPPTQPLAGMRLLSNVGHLLQVEAAGDVADTVKEYLAVVAY